VQVLQGHGRVPSDRAHFSPVHLVGRGRHVLVLEHVGQAALGAGHDQHEGVVAQLPFLQVLAELRILCAVVGLKHVDDVARI
jgi:hypothetical protein